MFACEGVAATLSQQSFPAERRHALPEVPASEARGARSVPRAVLRLRPRLARPPAAPGQLQWRHLASARPNVQP